MERYLEIDNIIIITGKAETSDDSVKITVDKVFSIEEAVSELAKSYAITVDLDKVSIEQIKEAHNLIIKEQSTGSGKVYFNLKSSDSSFRKKYLSYNNTINLNLNVFNKLVEIFGVSNVRIAQF